MNRHKIKKLGRRLNEFCGDYYIIGVAALVGFAAGGTYQYFNSNKQWNLALERYGIDLRDFHMINTPPLVEQ